MSLKVYRKDGRYMGETVPLGTPTPPEVNVISTQAQVGRGDALPQGWKSLGCDTSDPPTCRAQAPDGTIYYSIGDSGWVAENRTLSSKTSAPSPGRAQPIQPPPNGNRLGEPAVSMDDLLQEAIDMMGKQEKKRTPADKVAGDEQQEWRWDGNKYVFTTAEDEKARGREAALSDIAKRREDMAKRKPQPYR